ncbi:MAG: hypothetical protein IKI69_08065 [Oscillospiraceae bacterium]|nr:hypothetical protein [Oscillospiraceae bacterium]
MMEENGIFQENEMSTAGAGATAGKKPLDVAALVLGIVAIVAAAFSPLVSYVCGIIGLVFAIKHRKEKRTTVALILCIVGLIAGVVSNVLAARMVMDAIAPTLDSAA